jgi:dTDP-4-dehydrorhamnose 3,5-epimerase
MKATPLAIPEILLLEPQVFSDSRGHFFESFNETKFTEILQRKVNFVQDNQAYSLHGVLRGLHFQVVKPQAKLVRVISGEVFDVAVDCRMGSATYGQWVGEILSAENKRQLWIPEGFAHAYCVISESAEFHYKVNEYWYPEHDRCIRFDDPTLAIKWPANINPILSDKDKAGASFEGVEKQF